MSSLRQKTLNQWDCCIVIDLIFQYKSHAYLSLITWGDQKGTDAVKKDLKIPEKITFQFNDS